MSLGTEKNLYVRTQNRNRDPVRLAVRVRRSSDGLPEQDLVVFFN